MLGNITHINFVLKLTSDPRELKSISSNHMLLNYTQIFIWYTFISNKFKWNTTFDLEWTAGSVLRERSLASGSISATSALGTSSLILHLPIEDMTLPRFPAIALLSKPPLSLPAGLRSRVPGKTYSPWSS